MDAPPVQYVKTSDGFNIAYSVAGNGPPLVFLPMRLSHLQLAWDDPSVAPWLRGLASRFRLVRYDSRGQGMSSRNLPDEFQVYDYERDLTTVLDRLGIQQAVLMAHAVFGHVAIRYAVAHKERVDALVLFPMATTMRWLRFLETARENWDLFLHQQVGGSALAADQRRIAIERLRQTMTHRDFLICTNAFYGTSVAGDLSQLNVPTMLIHPKEYPIYSQEETADIVAAIPDARMVLIDGATALGNAAQGLAAIDDFFDHLRVGQATATHGPDIASLSTREIDVLRLLAAGRTNQQIADDLVISLNTVRRHVSNIFDKTGAANRAQATAYAKDHGLA